MQFLQLPKVGRWGSLGSLGFLIALLLGLLHATFALGQEPDDLMLDPYVSGVNRARAATTPEQLTAAIAALTALLPSYPQDVDIPLELGRLCFQSRRYADALYFYNLALENGASGGDADLGIGWSLVMLGQCRESRSHFHAVLAGNPDHARALAGLQQCSAPSASVPAGSANQSVPTPTPKRVSIEPQVAQGFFFYRNNPSINYAVAPLGRLSALINGFYYASVAYRYSYFVPSTSQLTNWNQHDLYVDAGLGSRRLGLTFHYGLVVDGSGVTGTSHHVGLTGRLSSFWDALLNLSASFYQDAPTLRAALDWRIPIGAGFSIQPGAAAQWTPGAGLGILTSTVFYDHRWLSLWAGGKVGDEQRAAYLNVGYIYIGTAHIPYGAWGGALFRPGAGFSLSLAYNYDRLLRNDTTPVQDSQLHALTATVAKEF